MSVREAVLAVAVPAVQALGFQVVDVEYLKEGSRWFVRAYIYRNEGVSLDDCVAINHALGDALEAAETIKTPYHLEVSSPGAERVLKTEWEYMIFQGRWVRVQTKEPLADGTFTVFGRLGPATAEALTLYAPADSAPSTVSRAEIKQIRLALDSDVPGLRKAAPSGERELGGSHSDQ